MLRWGRDENESLIGMIIFTVVMWFLITII